ncbi:MAG: acyl carrier protein [Vicinamibacterales bacterium]
MLPGARVPRFLPLIPKHATEAALGSEDTLVKLLEKTPESARRDVVLARVRDHGARVLGTSAGQISLEQPLAELGLDSLMAVELAGGLERDLGQPVSVMQVLGAGSLAAIAQLAMKMLGLTTDDGAATTVVAPAQVRA